MSPPLAYAKGIHTPKPLIGLAELMSRVFKGENLVLTGKSLLARSHQDDPEALLDLSVLLQLQHQKETGLALQKEALKQQQVFSLNPDKNGQKIKLLAIYTSGDLMTNTPLEFIAQGADFSLQMLYVASDLPVVTQIPEHDIAIIALSELDRNLEALALIEQLLPALKNPILNSPSQIRALARDRISQTLQGLDAIEIPATSRLSKHKLLGIKTQNKALKFPLIIRPIDSHAGIDLAKIENFAQLDSYLSNSADSDYFVAPFIDYKNPHGEYQKYRIMLVNGQPFIAHMAISDHWMIHYLNAGMLDCATKRFSEAQAMGSFDHNFAAKHQRAFAQLTQAVGLDYFGIDCAETQDGKLLIFEACASLNIHAMDCEKIFPYKKPQMQKIFDAFQQMLIDKISSASAVSA